MRKKNKLTNKQKQFVIEYTKDSNATQAAIRAGYKHPDNGRQLLTKTHVSEAIKARQKKIAYSADISQERLLHEEKCISFSDPGELFKDNYALIPIKDLPEHVRRGISSFEVIDTTTGTGKNRKVERKYKYKLWDKGKSLDRVEKHLGMFQDKEGLGLTKEILILLIACIPETHRDGVKRELEKILASR